MTSSTPLPSSGAIGSEGARRIVVAVSTGSSSYDIVIGPGLIAEAGDRLRQLDAQAACAVVTDRSVAAHHGEALHASLDSAGVRCVEVILEPGEATKSYAGFASVCDAILEARLERGDFVLALGGGVVGDLAGFCAASVRRGMRVVQVPTSLLAQVDSSVGGKTGINAPAGKNLVGAFHQPSLVLADTDALDTLPARERRAGYAEIFKYGLIDDAAFVTWLERHHGEVVDGGPGRIEAIAHSCRSKAAIVARDEFERGDRALLNLGHTFGHALERITGYDGTRLVHGEGVAIGMALAFRFSHRLGLMGAADAERVTEHLRMVGLPTRITDIAGWTAPPQAMLDAIAQDKKVKQGRLTFILARGIGQSFVAHGIDPADVVAFLTAEIGST